MKAFTVCLVLFVCSVGDGLAAAVEEEETFEIQAPPRPYLCPTHDAKGNKRYHLETSVKLNWFDALRYCQRHHRRLAIVTCKEQNDQIIELIEEAFPDAPFDTSVWIGGSDLAKEGSWVWNTTGQPIQGYTNWHDGNPSNTPTNEHCPGNRHTSQGNEHCLDYWRYNNEFKWNDNRCCRQFSFICEDIAHY